jgi:Endoglucanase
VLIGLPAKKAKLAGASIPFFKNLGVGVNLGNSLEVFGAETETGWGNAPVTREIIHKYAEAGFKTVRIPVTWSEHMDANYNISPAFLARVEEIVNYVLEEGMYAIIDAHHDDNFFYIPDKTHEQETTKFYGALWTQISARFKDYGENLFIRRVQRAPRRRELHRVVGRHDGYARNSQ